MGFKDFRNFDVATDIIFGIDPDRRKFVFGHLHLKPLQLRRKDIPLFIDGYDDPQSPGVKKTDHLAKTRDSHRAAVLTAYPEASPGLFKLDTNAYDRKKSKGSLFWAAQIGVHAHFVMYELASEASQKMVANKTSTFGAAENKGDVPKGARVESRFAFDKMDYTDEYKLKQRNVSGSELRWLYRMRNNKLIQTYIQFWRSDDGKTFVQCPPPWEWGSPFTQIWEGYVPRHEGFYDSLLGPGSL